MSECFSLFLPCGLHSRAFLATCSSVVFSVWPIYHHARCSISSCISRCPACLQSSLIRILLGHQTTRMLLRHLLIETCNFCFSPLVKLHVSALCKSTAFLFTHRMPGCPPPTPLFLQSTMHGGTWNRLPSQSAPLQSSQAKYHFMFDPITHSLLS